MSGEWERRSIFRIRRFRLYSKKERVMEIALNKLRELLASAGLNPEETDILLFQFLEEEAYPYVELMNIYHEDPERFRELTEHEYKA